MIVQAVMKVSEIAQNPAVNLTTVGSAWWLSLAQTFNFIEGILPTVALLLSTLVAGALLFLHLKNHKKASLEIKILEKRLKEMDE